MESVEHKQIIEVKLNTNEHITEEIKVEIKDPWDQKKMMTQHTRPMEYNNQS